MTARGFTLLELLIAMVLLGLVMVLLAGGGRIVGRLEAAIERRAVSLADFGRGLDQLRWRLGGALIVDLGRDPFFEGDNNAFRFVAVRPDFEPGWPLAAVEVDVVPQGGGSAVRLRAAALDPARPDFDVLDEAPARTLFEAPVPLDLAYLPRPPERGAAGGGRQRWQDGWDDPRRLPAAVRIAAPKAPGRFPTALLTIAPDLPADCASEANEDPALCG